ncbi:MAG TPA: (2Fe-2S) ferredoxin domain-containing protein [Spirochaetota bacterium]|nr:(2Fe-2S) ferredoxin domain-containing protein [Spirochaetota bacterium]
MKKPDKHIFVCASFRMSGDPQGVCHKKGSASLIQYLEQELSDRGLAGISVSSTGCLKVCDRGPAMVVYPDNIWYGKVEDEAAIDEIIDAIENGSVAEKYVIA